MKNYIYSAVFIFTSTLFLLFSFELFLSHVYYEEWVDGDSCSENIADIRGYTLKKNCSVTIKHWEADLPIKYSTNASGRRDSKASNNNDGLKVAFYGDSFTYGSMSDVEKTYPSVFMGNINQSTKFIPLNFGVPGYDLHEILKSIVENSRSDHRYIIYGLTPNDLFRANHEIPKSEASNKTQTQTEILRPIKPTSLSTNIKATNLYLFKFIMSLALRGDKFYISLYRNRGIYSGYLDQVPSEDWGHKYDSFRVAIGGLPKDIRSKLNIVILPQLVQVSLFNNNQIKEARAFEFNILGICDDLKISCYPAPFEELSKIKKSHYYVDGHMTDEGNKLIGANLAKIFKF